MLKLKMQNKIAPLISWEAVPNDGTNEATFHCAKNEVQNGAYLPRASNKNQTHLSGLNMKSFSSINMRWHVTELKSAEEESMLAAFSCQRPSS